MNNSLPSRNCGMKHALQSSEWRDLFDVVIVGARKPSFYSDSNRSTMYMYMYIANDVCCL